MKEVIHTSKERFGIIVLALIIVGYFLIQYPTLRIAPNENYDGWRQTDTYAIAINYLQYDMNPFAPQLNYDGTGNIVCQLELQIVPYLSALIFQVFGFTSPFAPRLISMIFYLGSAVFLYGICRFFINILPSLMSVCLYLFMPISLLYSRAIMPEACAMFFYCGAMFFFFRWYFKESRPAPWLSAVFMAFAILEKIPVAFAGIVIIAGFLIKEKKQCLRKAHFWGYGLVALGPPVLYYLLLGSASEQRFVNGIAEKHIFSDKLLGLLSADTVSFFKGQIPLYLGVAVLFCAVLGFLFCLKQERKLIAVWTLAFVLEFATIVAIIKFGYYMIFIAPVLALLSGVFLHETWLWRKRVAVAVFALVFAFTSYKSVSHWSSHAQENLLVSHIAECIDSVTDKSDVIAISTISPEILNTANRRAFRANIRYHDYIPEGAEAETDYYISQGVSYFVVAGSVYDDASGEYLRYLNNTFPVVYRDDDCIIFSLLSKVSQGTET